MEKKERAKAENAERRGEDQLKRKKEEIAQHFQQQGTSYFFDLILIW